LSLQFHFEPSIGYQLVAIKFGVFNALEWGESNQLHFLHTPLAKIMDCKPRAIFGLLPEVTFLTILIGNLFNGVNSSILVEIRCIQPEELLPDDEFISLHSLG
jgi:hypothetical protein